MTRHLGDAEFVDLLEGTCRPEHAAHLQACERCRATADAVSAARSAASGVEIPEPSPLFWEHFSARVRSAIDEEPFAPAARMPFAGFARWAGLAVAAAVALAVVFWRPAAPGSDVVIPEAGQIAEVPDESVADEPFGDLDDDEAWAVVRSVADQMEEDDINAAGMGSRPGSAERVADALSESERTELAALIEREIKSLAERVPSS